MAPTDLPFSIDDLTPHGVCLLWNPGLIWLHVVSDAAIAAAYLAIPAALVIVGRRRPDLNPFRVLYWFAAFIVLCAATHLASVVTLWQPWYVLTGLLKLICAVVSVVTAALTWRILGFVLKAPGRAEVEAANAELKRLNEELEERVSDRTRELSATNERLVVAVYEAREANRIRADFTARMSHELRTPLNAIIGFTEMLLAGVGGRLADRQRGYCGDIHAAGIQLLERIDGILDLERIGRGADSPVPGRLDLAEVCEDAIGRMRVASQEAGIAVTCEVPRGVAVWADGRALLTILVNLVSNAVKYSPRGTTVRVQGGAIADGAVVRVVDQGYGVAERSLSRVFEPFYRAHEQELPAVGGTGLGLPLVKALVEAHGGDLEFASRPGEGTTVTVRLPAEGHGGTGSSPGIVNPSDPGRFTTGPVLAQP